MNDNYDILRPETDKNKVKAYAELLNEMAELGRKLGRLEALEDRNANLKDYVWRTAEGIYLAFSDMTDDHLVNTMAMIINNGRRVPNAMQDEAERRGLRVTHKLPSIIESDDTRMDDIPF